MISKKKQKRIEESERAKALTAAARSKFGCEMYNIDENTGKEVHHRLIMDKRPEKTYTDGSCEDYGERWQRWRKI